MPLNPNADIVFADGPMAAPYQPEKPAIRRIFKQVEQAIDAFSAGAGSIAKATKAQLDADLARGADVTAWVYNDPTVANNGIYRKNGVSGSGSWTRILDLPFSFIVASNPGAGTPNAIQATTSNPVSSSALVILPIAATNTASPVTVSFNGGAPLTIKTNSGEDVRNLAGGSVVYGVITGATYRLANDEAIASLIYEARDKAVAAANSSEAEADRARDEAYRSEAARDTAAGYASDAVSQGNVPIYATVAGMPAIEIPVGVNVLRVNGYHAAGDGGGALYAKVDNEPEHLGKFQTADGVWWELVATTVNPVMFGARADGITDDAPAIMAAQAFGRPVDLDGVYFSKSQIVFYGPTVLVGRGRDKSKIIWGASASGFGIKVVPTTWEDYISITDIGLWTRGSTGTAIDISWLSLSALPIPYFDPRCNIFRNDIRGETVSSQGFVRGIRLDFQFGARVEGNMIQGIYVGGDLASSDFESHYGIEIPDQSTRTLANLHINQNVIFGFQTAVAIYNVEGVWFADNDLQVCFDGLVIDNPLTRVNQYRIGGNHIGVSNIQISVRRARQVLMSENEISYRFGRTGAPLVSLVVLDSVDSGNVTSNTIRGNVTSDANVVLTGISLLDTTGILTTRNFTVDDNQFQNLSIAIAPASTSSSNTFGAGNNFIGIRVARMSNGGTNSILQSAFMGSGLYEVPSGQNPALMLSGKGAASLFVNRDGDGAVQGFSRINTIVGTITVSAGATAYNTSSDEQWKTFRGEYDPIAAIKLIKADPVMVFDWDEEHGGTRAIGWGAQTSYALSADLASRGFYFDPRTHQECSAESKWYMNPFTSEECSADDSWIVDEGGSPISEMKEGAAKVFPEIITAAYQPWGIDQGKRTPYLWAAVSLLVDEVESLKKKVQDLESRQPKGVAN
ncbi:hypothetical protein DSM25558_0182 [Agrobacterium sp. DSM 25558]|uniref:hypothetical protein n=1 Tax=Agrobacterium sp. DSM 25558 TaxID=1907665 RepID=UPI0009725462|nr:hypothetical protein [Agrobacterium sp. DSM 25558]SCX00814.1 hypothetical protein DSM25558_0182 [Agrobacterium sp. DSM 25558]